MTVPVGENPQTWCYNHEGIGGGSSPGAFFSNTADEFDLANIPVVTETWVPAGQDTMTLSSGQTIQGAIQPGYWATSQIGTGADLIGLFNNPGMQASSPSWTGTFVKSFVTSFSLKEARAPNETTLGCMRRVASALGGSSIASAWSGLMAAVGTAKLASLPVQLVPTAPGVTVTWLDRLILDGGVSTFYQRPALRVSAAIAQYSGPALELAGAAGVGLVGGLAVGCR